MPSENVLYYDETYAEEEVYFLRSVRQLELNNRVKMRTPAVLTPSQSALAARICKAFAHITAGPDTTLYLSGEAEDGYLNEAFIAELRRREVRDDWQSIPPSLLMACDCALSYVDAEGMLYLLPAWMLAELQYPTCVTTGLEICLSCSSDDPELTAYCNSKLSLLNDEQRACVTDCIRELRLRECEEDLAPWGSVHLLPWEEADRAAHFPHLNAGEYAAQDLRRYCEQHGAAPPSPPESPSCTPNPAPTREEQVEMQRLFREEVEAQRRFYHTVVATLKTPLTRTRRKLAERIRKVFAGVRVGGETLLYLSAKTTHEPLSAEFIDTLRAEEIRDDWQRIPQDILYSGQVCICSLEPDALLYLLPAYMLMALEHTGLLLSSIDREFFPPSRLSLFNAAQLACVDEFFRIRPTV